MPFPFVFVCEILSQLEKHHRDKKKPGSARSRYVVLAKWFSKHRALLDHPTTDMSALFSTLLPEKRTDRVYYIQETTLVHIIGRACCLGRSRLDQLREYQLPGKGDLADCVGRVISQAPSPMYDPTRPVTVEEVDSLLHGIAASCRFSSKAVQDSRSTLTSIRRDDLGNLYCRLSAFEATWLTRLVLKSFGVASLDPLHVYQTYDRRLPAVLQIRDGFENAIQSLRLLRNAQPLGLGDVMKQLKPALGVKVGRQSWLKGRSIKNCVDMSPGRISCEKKMDGEYCQIHIDLMNFGGNIQIFSKSGKDSTKDRVGLHGIIRESLRLGRQGQTIVKGCILEGEMVVYNDRLQRIMPFDVIRKYVARSGVFIGLEQDSPRDRDEHLMIVYFDVLLVDDESLLGLPQTERFDRLRRLVTCRPGYAELVMRQVIDLDRQLGVSHLRKAFAESILRGEEGLVLKPDEPYFDFSRSVRKYSCCPIKVKKGYFQGLGDLGDFAVVGARYDASIARSYNIPGIKWTHFFLGCINNKDAVFSGMAKPRFIIVESVELNEPQLRAFIRFANPAFVAVEDATTFDLDIPHRISCSKGPDFMFTTPPVFDIRCFSFTKQGNTGFYTPRFPQVSKIHYDRHFMDTVTFAELQAMAEDAARLRPLEDSQEMLEWIGVLEAADPRGRVVDAASQVTASSDFTHSPRSCVSRHSQSSSFPSLGSPTRPERPFGLGHTAARNRSQPAQSLPPASSHLATVHQPTTALDLLLASRQECKPPQSAGEHSNRSRLKRSLPASAASAGESKRPKKQLAKDTVPSITPPKAKATEPKATMAFPVGDDVVLAVPQADSAGEHAAHMNGHVNTVADQIIPFNTLTNSAEEHAAPVIIQATAEEHAASVNTQADSEEHVASEEPIAPFDSLNNSTEEQTSAQAAAEEQIAPVDIRTNSAEERVAPIVTHVTTDEHVAPAVTRAAAEGNAVLIAALAAEEEHIAPVIVHDTAEEQVSTQAVSEEHIAPVTAQDTAEEHVTPVVTQATAANGQAAHYSNQPSRASDGCRYLGHNCTMTDRDIILSPCIQDFKLLTETLLPGHGITNWRTNPLEWAQDASLGVSFQELTPPYEDIPSQADQSQVAQQPRRRAKLCFVEATHLDKTIEFAGKITQLQLRRPNGEREHVEIFDWRAVEFLADLEKAAVTKQPRNTRYTGRMLRFFVGLA